MGGGDFSFDSTLSTPARRTQIAWVYTDHAPDYKMVTFKEWKSLVIVVGCAVLLTANFFAAKAIVGARDRRHARLAADDAPYARLDSERPAV